MLALPRQPPLRNNIYAVACKHIVLLVQGKIKVAWDGKTTSGFYNALLFTRSTQTRSAEEPMLSEKSALPAVPAEPFIGRDAFLRTVRETLLAERLAVITGPRGVGKTALAREYARRFASEYQQVLWIDATLFSSLLSDALNLAQRFDLPLGRKQNIIGVVAAVQEWASARQQTLVVLDNVVFPPGAPSAAQTQPIGGHILLIARDLEGAPDAARQLQSVLDEYANQFPPLHPELAEQPAATFLRLRDLTASEGALLVLRRANLLSGEETLEQAGDEQRQLALELARELRGSPLALHLAGAYLRLAGTDLQDYLLAFRSDPTQPGSAGSEALQVIAPACNLLLAHLERAQPGALAILQTCALLAPTAIPLALLQQENLRQTLFLEQEEKPEELLSNTLQTLLACGLLAERGASFTLAMPPLLQVAIRQLMPLEKQRGLREHLLRACAQLALAEENELQTLATAINLVGHIWFLASQDAEQVYPEKEVADALGWAASLLGEQDLVSEAEPLLQRALTIWERTLGLTHPTLAGAQFHLAILNARLKQYAQAETYAQMAITNTSYTLGVNHPNVLRCLTALGQIYQQQEKHQNARLCYEKAIFIGDRVGLQTHPYYQAARQALETLQES